MTEKELKRLSRAELLELLLMQTRESELLRMQLAEAQQALESREIRIREAGNLADAALAINGVLESAQKAAEQYLENIARMEAEAKVHYQQMMDNPAPETEQTVHTSQEPMQPQKTEPEAPASPEITRENPAFKRLKVFYRKAMDLIHDQGYCIKFK